jgi:hypothetical protein
VSFGAEDMGWVEPEEMGRGAGDSMMQDAFVRALTDPCYICACPVPLNQGWRREGRAWCLDHRPVWSHQEDADA